MKVLIVTTDASLRKLSYILKQLNIKTIDLDFYKFDPATFNWNLVEVDSPEYKVLQEFKQAYYTFYRWSIVVDIGEAKLKTILSISGFTTKRGHRMAFHNVKGNFNKVIYYD